MTIIFGETGVSADNMLPIEELIMSTVSLDGISLHVADLAKSLDFYQRIPGIEILVNIPDRFIRMKLGNGYLHLVKAPVELRFHMEMGTEDLMEMYNKLLTVGIQPEGPPAMEPWGRVNMWVKDPDGNLLQFDAEPETLSTA